MLFYLLLLDKILLPMNNSSTVDLPKTHADFKAQARALKVTMGIKSSHAHEFLARLYGFKTHISLITYYQRSSHET